MLGPEIKRLVDQYNPKTIYLRDELFFRDQGRVRAFMDYYRQNEFKFLWRSSIRATDVRENYVDEQMLRELGECGCEVLKFGFESGSDRILKKIKKGIKLSNIHHVVDVFSKQSKVQLNASFLVGLPGETFEEIGTTIGLATRIQQFVPNARIVGPQYYRVYPGGELYEEVVREWGFRVPDTLEGWVARYRLPENTTDTFDRGIRYPWMSARTHELAGFADLFPAFFFSSGFRYHEQYKLKLLNLLRPLIRLRVRFGWYHFLVDLRLAQAILDFSIWQVLESSPLYRWLHGTRFYQTVRQMSFYRKLVKWVTA